jgi:predicted acylesterase/phospholipase RssA
MLMDGGVANNRPISHAVDLQAEQIYILPTGHACALEQPPLGARPYFRWRPTASDRLDAPLTLTFHAETATPRAPISSDTHSIAGRSRSGRQVGHCERETLTQPRIEPAAQFYVEAWPSSGRVVKLAAHRVPVSRHDTEHGAQAKAHAYQRGVERERSIAEPR